jgi:hypothetical protein
MNQLVNNLKKITILSIDLAWSANNITAVTYYELTDSPKGYVLTEFRSNTFRSKRDDEHYSQTIKESIELKDKVDFILLDMPILGNEYKYKQTETTFRGVEYALLNFASIECFSGKLLCFPTFMAGGNCMHKSDKVICEEGYKTAKALLKDIGSDKASVIEVFPQTAIPMIMKCYPKETEFVEKLAPHKKQKKIKGHEKLRDILIKVLKKSNNIPIGMSTMLGLPDLCDSVLGALPFLDLLTEGKFLSKDIVWLLYNPGTEIHPHEASSVSEKKILRYEWISKIHIKDLDSRILNKGIVCYAYDWLEQKEKHSKMK